MIEVKEILRLWLAGHSLREVTRLAGLSPRSTSLADATPAPAHLPPETASGPPATVHGDQRWRSTRRMPTSPKPTSFARALLMSSTCGSAGPSTRCPLSPVRST